MTDVTQRIAGKVRGIAAEANASQQDIAAIINRDRKTVHERWHGRVPFTAAEVFMIAEALDVPVTRFFPERVTLGGVA